MNFRKTLTAVAVLGVVLSGTPTVAAPDAFYVDLPEDENGLVEAQAKAKLRLFEVFDILIERMAACSAITERLSQVTEQVGRSDLAAVNRYSARTELNSVAYFLELKNEWSVSALKLSAEDKSKAHQKAYTQAAALRQKHTPIIEQQLAGKSIDKQGKALAAMLRTGCSGRLVALYGELALVYAQKHPEADLGPPPKAVKRQPK